MYELTMAPHSGRKNCPCLDCETRHEKCHDECVAYKKWQVHYLKVNRDYRNERNKDTKTRDYQIAQMIKNKKRGGKK